MLIRVLMVVCGMVLAASEAIAEQRPRWPWLTTADAVETLGSRVPVPSGFTRVPAEPGSFAAWLRDLPMKPADATVKLFDGRNKWRQDTHFAVVDMDIGTRDLQQCADAIMRLYAEYDFARGKPDTIVFDYTGAGPVAFSRWANGERPVLRGKRLVWQSGGRRGADYANLRSYLTAIYTYAGTFSLAAELERVEPQDLAIGDIIIRGGFPGHAVLVTDMIQHESTGERRLLLLQSYIPAQDIHVIVNPMRPDISPWFAVPEGVGAVFNPLITPDWAFTWADVRRFPASRR